MRYLAMTLGVVTAIGGFLDIGEFVSLPQAGASFGLALLPIVILGTIGAMVYAEMAGRIELASRRTVFDLIRKRLGLRVGLVALAAALALNVLTLVAEIGGMAFVAELVLGRRFLWYVVPLAIAARAVHLARLVVVAGEPAEHPRTRDAGHTGRAAVRQRSRLLERRRP